MMWRSLFLAVGICLCILGAEGLIIDRTIMNADVRPQDGINRERMMSSSPGREMITPEWAPWSFLSSGAVIILYSMTLAKAGGAPA